MTKLINIFVVVMAIYHIIAMNIILFIKGILFTIFIMACMYFFETIGLSFLFKDFLLMKMSGMNITDNWKYGISLAFSSFASLFCVSVVLYVKIHGSERVFNFYRLKIKEGKFIAYVLGLLIFIGYLKGYQFPKDEIIKLNGIETLKQAIYGIEFYYQFVLYVVAALFLSVLSVFTNFLVADRIMKIDLKQEEFNTVYIRIKTQVDDFLKEIKQAKRISITQNQNQFNIPRPKTKP